MNEQAINMYLESSVNAASPGELTLMLYNGCLKFIKHAEKAMGKGELETKNKMIMKAQDIITDMMVTLNRDIEVSKEILPIYDYIHHQLMEANTKNNKEALQEAYTYTKDLKDTWVEVLKMEKQGNLT